MITRKIRRYSRGLLLGLLLASQPPCGWGQQDTKSLYIVAIDATYAPYEYVDKRGRVTGFTVALLHKIGARAGIVFRFEPMLWPEAVSALDSGKIDLINMIQSPERAKRYELSEPHSSIKQALFRTVSGRGGGLKNMAGLTVALQKSDISLERLAGRSDFAKVVVQSKEQGMLLVQSGKVDAFMAEEQAGLYLTQEYKLNKVKIAVMGLFPEKYGFAARKGNRALILLLNKNLQALKTSGEYDALVEKWLITKPPDASWRGRYQRPVLGLTALLAAAAVLFAAWSISLRRNVKLRTLALRQQLRFTSALNELAEIILSEDDPELILQAVPRLVGETLAIDRSLVYDVSFGRSLVSGLSEWLNPACRDIQPTKADYPLSMFIVGASEMLRTGKAVISHSDDVNPCLLADNSFKVLHRQMKINSLLWHPFARRDQGYYLLVLNHLRCKREWTAEERAFLDSVSGQVSIALAKIAVVNGRKQAEDRLRDSAEMQVVLNAMLRSSLSDVPLGGKLAAQLEILFSLSWLTVERSGAVFVINTHLNALVLTAQQGLPSSLLAACATVPFGRCLCGKAAESGRVVECTESSAEHHSGCADMAPHGHYCAPIIAGGKTLGVLNLYLKEGVSLTAPQRDFIQHVTDIMAGNILHSRTEEKLSRAQKMESLGQLAGGIAHDFNNILTAIKCYAGFVRKGLDPQDPKTGDLREILTAADRATALTGQLLAFSRKQVLMPRVVDLNKCVASVANMLSHIIGENIALKIKLAPEPCPVLLDLGQIEQVLVNLVVNARDAISGDGTIEISTELLPLSEDLLRAHPDLPRGPIVCLKVRDTGCGMTAEVISHIFDPFYTTKEHGKGTGLGLSTVFGVVKQSGGDIEVESETGKGASFHLWFPSCSQGPAAAEDDKGGQVPGNMQGRETILLVEDEASLLRVCKGILESSGYLVLTAAGGKEALAELERHGRPVDLLLTDVVMPGLSGRDLALQLARRNMAGRTLYMSGYTDDAIVNHGVLEPGLAFIRKPFTSEGLLVSVRAVLDAPAGESKA